MSAAPLPPPRLSLRRALITVRAPTDRGRRMRIIATGLLLAMAGLYLITRQLQHLHPAWGFVLAFTEAAMVGGLADWFAVTALFRHPLGLPIPHTAIIPVNKNRIADSMAVFLQDNFLTPPVIARRISAMNVAAAVGSFLAEPTGHDSEPETRLRAGVANLIGDALESLDQEKLGGLVKGALRSQLEKIELAPLLGQLLGAAIADQRHMPLFEDFIRWAGAALEDNEPLIREMIHRRANALLRLTKLDETVANAVLDGIYKLLAETVVIADHPVRRKLEEGLDSLAYRLVHDREMQQRVEGLKHEILANPAFARWLDGLWERGRAALLALTRDPDGALAGQLGQTLAELGQALQRDQRLQLLVNRFARRTVVGTATRYGGQIVRLVSETVRRWDGRTISDRIEAAVGRDLQFIRINGTVVGGLVGVAIHAFDTLL